jgi:hypothetical protein
MRTTQQDSFTNHYNQSHETIQPLDPRPAMAFRIGADGLPMKAKAAVIRPGQRHPYRKGTQAQIDERIGFVLRLLAAGARKMEIHRAVRQRFNIQWRQVDRYLQQVFTGKARANKWLPRVQRLETSLEPIPPQSDYGLEMTKLCYPDYFK